MRENSAIPPRADSNFRPDVPLPPGATPGVGDWSRWDNEYRIIYGAERKIVHSEAWVQASAVQLPDGRLDSKTGPSRSAPGISVPSHWEEYLSSSQARQLAGAIVAAADELDTWQRDRHRCTFGWCTTQAAGR